MPSLRDVVDATLAGCHERLVARCNVADILSALDQYGIYDVQALSVTLDTAFGALQTQVGAAAPPAFLGLLHAHLRPRSMQPPPIATPATPVRAPQQHTPSTGGSSSSSDQALHENAAALPFVVTVKFNGKTIAERASLSVSPIATWESVARQRLGERAHEFEGTAPVDR